MFAWYNETDPYATAWLRNLIERGLIMPGIVDERSIVEVQPEDLKGFTQCHFFAGVGGWPLAAQLAGWSDERELWTGSAPCQPFSVAGKQSGTSDERHLWPHYFRLIRAGRPAVCMGEQVAAAVGKDWLDGVFADLEGIGYACGAAVVPACAVNAPHRRDRLWFVAESRILDHGDHARLEGLARHDADARERALAGGSIAATCRGSIVRNADQLGPCAEREQRSGQLGGAGRDSESGAGRLADAVRPQWREVAKEWDEHDGHDAGREETPSGLSVSGAWDGAVWIIGHDGKARRVEPGIRLLAHGVPARVGKLRAYGNAIVPQVAAEVIKAWMDVRP